jgi:hypothetical protein
VALWHAACGISALQRPSSELRASRVRSQALAAARAPFLKPKRLAAEGEAKRSVPVVSAITNTSLLLFSRLNDASAGKGGACAMAALSGER